MKDHHFGRLNDFCLTVYYHLDDIAWYLEKYSSMANGISILDRSFIDMTILKPIFAAISLLGIHIWRPFHKLMMDPSTDYSTLLEAYLKLYDKGQTVSPKNLLKANVEVFNFVSSSTFSASLPSGLLLANLKLVSDEYEHEIISLDKISLKLFSDRLHHQKGVMFGFGPAASDKSSDNVLKISSVDKKTLSTLVNNVQVHNIGEERNVGKKTCKQHVIRLSSTNQRICCRKTCQ